MAGFSGPTLGAIKSWTEEYVQGVIGSTGIKVGTIDQNSTGFPTTRPDGSALHKEDYVTVSGSAILPFTLDGKTFSTKLDRGVWSGTVWGFSAGSVVESDEVAVSEKSIESISGTATTQSAVNIEIKQKFTDINSLINTLDEEYKKAGFTFSATITDLNGLRTITLNVKDKQGNNLLNKDLTSFVISERTIAGYDLSDDIEASDILDAIKDLPAELTNKIIDCGTFN